MHLGLNELETELIYFIKDDAGGVNLVMVHDEGRTQAHIDEFGNLETDGVCLSRSSNEPEGFAEESCA